MTACGLGTQQLATTAAATAPFQLLHLARGEENEEELIVRLAGAAEALVGRLGVAGNGSSRCAKRSHSGHGGHPSDDDDALDPRVEDADGGIEVVDHAAGVVIRGTQKAAAA